MNMENIRIKSDHQLSQDELDAKTPAGFVKHTWSQRQKNDGSWDIVLHYVPIPVDSSPPVVDE